MWQPTDERIEKSVDNIHRGSITKEDAIRKNIEPMIRAFMKCESNEEDLIRIVKRFVERGDMSTSKNSMAVRGLI